MIWRYLPPQLAHDLAPLGLRLWADVWGGSETPVRDPFTWRGIEFKNRIGVAGGVDKNARLLEAWQRLGFGFVEIGTVTPLPQKPNPGTIMLRDWPRKLLWNKMGFPSDGAREVQRKLAATRADFKGPVFVNIGKNRATPNEGAVDDYVSCVNIFQENADAFVVNVSSPNTAGLRGLQSAETLRPLLEKVISSSKKAPVLVKLSPDMELSDLRETVEASAAAGVAGFVLTNTTLDRPDPNPFPKEGGVSGEFLARKSVKTFQAVRDQLGSSRSQFLLVSVGGIFSRDELQARIDMGADLVQIYSALIFNGPGTARAWTKSSS